MNIIEKAYCKIFGVSEDDVQNPEHSKIVSNALLDVAYTENQFEGETEKQLAERLNLDGPSDGDATELASYFRQLYPGQFSELNPWEIVFEMYKRMKDNGELPESSDININTFEGGIHKMSTMENLNKLKALEEQEMGSDVVTAKPATETSVLGMKTASNIVKDGFAKRENYSKRAVATKVVLVKPEANKILVEGQSSVGTIINIQKQFETFCEKFGVIESNGDVTFEKVAPGNTENAKKLYNMFKEAMADATKTFPVYVSTASPAIKGYMVAEAEGKAGVPKLAAEALDEIMNKAAGFISFPDKSIQLRYRQATRKNTGNGKKGTGTSTKKNVYSGIVSLAITNKATAVEKYSEFYKTVTTEVEKSTRFKSAESAKYIKEEATEGNKAKTATYRIQLETNVYKLAVTNSVLKDAWGESTGAAGRTVEPINIKDIEKITSDLSSILAQAAAVSTADTGILADIKAGTIKAQQEDVAKQQEDVGVNL